MAGFFQTKLRKDASSTKIVNVNKKFTENRGHWQRRINDAVSHWESEGWELAGTTEVGRGTGLWAMQLTFKR